MVDFLQKQRYDCYGGTNIAFGEWGLKINKSLRFFKKEKTHQSMRCLSVYQKQKKESLIRKHFRSFSFLLLMCSSYMPASSALGAESAPLSALPRDSLKKLGQDFAYKIGHRLTEADLFLAGAGKLQLAEHKSKTRLPDNEPLLFHASLGENKVLLPQDLYTIKRGSRLMVSFEDFCTATDLAIDVNGEKGTADGWFIREDQTFHLDVSKNEAIIMGKTQKIDPNNIEIEDGNLLVSSEQLEKWFGLSFSYDLADLSLRIATLQPLPLEEKYLRTKKRKGNIYGQQQAALPEKEVPYTLFSQPYIDTTIAGTWVHTPGNAPVKSASWSTIINNDIAGFNAQSFASGSAARPYLNTLRLTMSKQDNDANLLGPLHATSYQFGDVAAVSLPLIGGGGEETGVVVTNRDLVNTTTDTSTDIRGDAQPGWDVELYRNETFVDIRHVDATGRYVFENVDLFAGNNDFKLLFFGPQGEIREEHQQIGVLPNELATDKGRYTASITRNDTTLWEREKVSTPGKGDINVAGKYELGVGDLGTANVGFRRSSDQGVQRSFAQTGFASYFADTYFNVNAGYDLDTFDNAVSLTARKTFGKQAVFLGYNLNSPGYNPSAPGAGAGLKDSYRLSLSGPIPLKDQFFRRMNYTFGSSYSNLYDDSKQLSLSSSFTAQIKAISLSNGFSYTRTINADGTDSETASASIISHGYLLGGNWRLESDFNILPVKQHLQDSLSYSRSLGENIDATAQIDYKPDTKFTTAGLSLNWRTAKATISPNISTDSGHAVRAGVNIHFGTAADPFTHSYSMYNAYMSGSGGVAAHIFLDKNGDGIFNGDDEHMPDVEVKALQMHRSAFSNERGIAFIPDLEQNRLTDIVVDQGSFTDSYGLSMFDGVSIRPHPGSVTPLEFPVVIAGEMDGQANYMIDGVPDAPARGLQMRLMTPDGKEEKSVTTAYDGYWAISSVRPGVYYLTATPRKTATPVYMVPEKVVFEAGGTTLYGRTPVLTKGYNVPFSFRSVSKAEQPRNRLRVEKPTDIEREEVFLHLGPYHSRLALTFAWYKFKLRTALNEHFDLVTPVSEIEPDAKNASMDIVLKPQRSITLQEATNTCLALMDKKFSCSVEVVTHYKTLDGTSTAGTANLSGKKG